MIRIEKIFYLDSDDLTEALWSVTDDNLVKVLDLVRAEIKKRNSIPRVKIHCLPQEDGQIKLVREVLESLPDGGID